MPRWPADRPSVKDRFYAKFIPEPNSGCWLWESWINEWGYGKISVNCRCVSAHRVSWEIHKGPIPKDLSVLHRCDVPSCVNPDHLFLGTPKDNVDDMEAKGRGRHPAGETHSGAKLTEDDIRAIRNDSRSLRTLAKIYGVNYTHISNIKHFRVWGNLL